MRLKALALFLISGLVGAGVVLALRSEPLKLKTVEVAGNRRVSKEELALKAGLRRGDHLLRISTGAVAARVEEIPWVASARVERIIPSRVRITVTERTPAAMIASGQTVYPADAEGVVLVPLPGATAQLIIHELPVADLGPGVRITTPAYRHAITVYHALDESLRAKVRLLRAPTVDRISIELDDGIVIVYGAAEDMAEKNFAIRTLLEQSAKDGSRISSIDVRVPKRPAVRPR